MYRSAAGSGHAAYTFLLNDLISYQSTGQGRTMIAGKFERA